MDFIRRLLQTVRAAPSDEELGRRSSVYPDETQSRKSMQVGYEDPNVVIQTSEKLMEFRMLVGITTHPSFKAPRGFNVKQRPVITSKGRPAPNMGLYPSVVKHEWDCQRKYNIFARTINICLVLQLVVAAALTALGAADGNRSAVTVFGGINTVIAGFLAYLKGSGLPNRLKYYVQAWTRVREYIEDRERDLGIFQRDMDIQTEVNVIRQMYDEVKADIEANTPDRFVGSIGSASRSGKPTVAALPTVSGVGLGGVISGIRDARSKIEGMTHEIDGSTASSEVNRARGRLKEDVSFLKSKLQQKLKEVEGLEQGIETEVEADIKHTIRVAEKGGEEFVDKEAKDLEKEVQNSREAAEEIIDDALRYEKR